MLCSPRTAAVDYAYVGGDMRRLEDSEVLSLGGGIVEGMVGMGGVRWHQAIILIEMGIALERHQRWR